MGNFTFPRMSPRLALNTFYIKNEMILFLDIDGVLKPFGHEPWENTFDPECVFWVKKLIEEFPLAVVISSAWRDRPDLDDDINIKRLTKIFLENNLDICITGTTPVAYNERGREVVDYLNDKHGADYVVLDDIEYEDEFKGYIPEENFFPCKSNIGFKEEEYLKVREYLLTL